MKQAGPARRALTLIEVLAAMMLLTLLATVCVSMVRVISRGAVAQSSEASRFDLLTLEELADELLQDHEARLRLLNAPDGYAEEVAVSDSGARVVVRVHHAAAAAVEPRSTYVCIAVSRGSHTVWRIVDPSTRGDVP